MPIKSPQTGGVPLPQKKKAVATDIPPLFPGQAVVEQLLAHLPDVAFFIKDTKERYVAINQLMIERYGVKERGDLIGRHVRDVYPDKLAAIFAAQDQAVLQTGTPIINHLEIDWYAHGRSGWCVLTKLPVRNESGEIVGLIGITRILRNSADSQTIPPSLANALEYLETHFDEALSPTTLAELSAMPLSRFARLIKRIFRMTPSQLIAQTRLAAAARMLRETSQPLSDIAQTCGYYDHSAMTRAFRSATGMAPSRFRELETR